MPRLLSQESSERFPVGHGTIPPYTPRFRSIGSSDAVRCSVFSPDVPTPRSEMRLKDRIERSWTRDDIQNMNDIENLNNGHGMEKGPQHLNTPNIDVNTIHLKSPPDHGSTLMDVHGKEYELQESPLDSDPEEFLLVPSAAPSPTNRTIDTLTNRIDGKCTNSPLDSVNSDQKWSVDEDQVRQDIQNLTVEC